MKRGTPRHPKVEHLRRLLRCDRATAIGYLELLWHFTAEYAPQGDIGKYEDAWIEASCSYEPRGTRRIGGLVQALIESRWVDVSPSNRLVIHDWIDHCDEYTRRRLERAKLSFVQNQQYTDKVTDKSPPAYAYAMPKPKPEPRHAGNGAVAVTDTVLDSSFSVICEMWQKGGKPLNDRDKEKALRKLMDYPGEEEQILRWCAHKFLTDWRGPQFTPYPDSNNGLGSEGWRRPIVERTIPTREDVKQSEFSRRVAEGVAREEAKKRDRS